MKSQILVSTATSILLLLSQLKQAFAVDGDPWIHDPSTVLLCNGKYYTYGTGGSGLVSDDGWTWHSGARLPIGGAAPDIIHIGDRYLVSIAVTGGGLGGGHAGGVRVMWSKSLDTNSPDYGFNDNTVVATSDGAEDCDAIDPSFLLDPNGRLWLTYGTFFGFIRLVELDPKTGHRIEGNQFVNIAIDNEATDLVYRDGWPFAPSNRPLPRQHGRGHAQRRGQNGSGCQWSPYRTGPFRANDPGRRCGEIFLSLRS